MNVLASPIEKNPVEQEIKGKKLSKWLEENLSRDFPHRSESIEIIKTITDSTKPIRGLLEKGITSADIYNRYWFQRQENVKFPTEAGKNVYGELQIHEDALTHSIIMKSILDTRIPLAFVASEEAEPVMGPNRDGIGITIDPVDGSSNVVVNRTVGTIVGLWHRGKIIASFYVLYGIYTNLVLAIDGKVAEFLLDPRPYGANFYHFTFERYLRMPNPASKGIRCIGGDLPNFSPQVKEYLSALTNAGFKDRYSGSFVGDMHAIFYYGGVYGYFPSPKGKLRLYYEWLPLAFICRLLGGGFYLVEDGNGPYKCGSVDNQKGLHPETLKDVHRTVCGGLIGSQEAVVLFRKTIETNSGIHPI